MAIRINLPKKNFRTETVRSFSYNNQFMYTNLPLRIRERKRGVFDQIHWLFWLSFVSRQAHLFFYLFLICMIKYQYHMDVVVVSLRYDFLLDCLFKFSWFSHQWLSVSVSIWYLIRLLLLLLFLFAGILSSSFDSLSDSWYEAQSYRYEH